MTDRSRLCSILITALSFVVLAYLIPIVGSQSHVGHASPPADCQVAHRRSPGEGIEALLSLKQLLLIVLLKLLPAAVVDVVVDDGWVELHADGLQDEAEDVSEDGVAGEEVFAAEAVYGFVEGQEVPGEHYQGSCQATADHEDDAGLHSISQADLPRLGGREVLQVEVELVDFVVAEQGDEEIDDEEDAAHDHPIVDHAVIAQVEVRIFKAAAVSQGDHEPHDEVDSLQEVDSPLNVILGGGIGVVHDAEDVEYVDADPNEQVPDGGQHEELLEEEVVQAAEDGLEEGEEVQPAILLRYSVVPLLGYGAIAHPKQPEHEHADHSLQQTQQTDETTLVAVENGRVRCRWDISIHLL